MPLMVGLHIATAMLAILSGTVLTCRSKGTVAHRRLGWIHCAAVGVMAVSSFGIYHLRDGPSVFHAVSILLTVVVAAGLAQPLWRRGGARWRYWHALLMPASLLMIIVTGVAQFFDQLPFTSAAANAVVFLQLPGIVGFGLIVSYARRYRPTQHQSARGRSGSR